MFGNHHFGVTEEDTIIPERIARFCSFSGFQELDDVLQDRVI